MAIEINNLIGFPVDKRSFTQVAKKVLIGENREIENISLAFVGKDEIQELNKKYRKKNKPTDVLSFNLDEKDCLGDIVICPDVVKEKGEDVLEVFVHGILHLLGYDHERSKKDEEIMLAKQDLYLGKIK